MPDVKTKLEAMGGDPRTPRLLQLAKETGFDGPYLKLEDDEGCAVSSSWSRRLGFQGKVVLHPRQLPIAAAAFAPDERELAWAREVDRTFTDAEASGEIRDILPGHTT